MNFGVHVAAVESWSGDMRLPNVLDRLQVGTYTGLTRTSFSDPSAGGIHWSSDSRGCNETRGSITIDTVGYAGDNASAPRRDPLARRGCAAGCRRACAITLARPPARSSAAEEAA